MHAPEGYQASGRERGAGDQQAAIQPDDEPLKALLLRLETARQMRLSTAAICSQRCTSLYTAHIESLSLDTFAQSTQLAYMVPL
jgi:hypothetical protein